MSRVKIRFRQNPRGQRPDAPRAPARAREARRAPPHPPTPTYPPRGRHALTVGGAGRQVVESQMLIAVYTARAKLHNAHQPAPAASPAPASAAVPAPASKAAGGKAAGGKGKQGAKELRQQPAAAVISAA